MLMGNTIPLPVLNFDMHESCPESPDESWKDISDVLEHAVDEYMLYGDAKLCCEKIEALLCNNFQYEQQPVGATPRTILKLHPLHHIALDAYVALASAFKVQTNWMMSSASEFSALEAMKMARTGAAFSLLLAGAVHYLFFLEHSLMGSAALFLIDAGESLLVVAKKSMEDSRRTLVNHFKKKKALGEVKSTFTVHHNSSIKHTDLSLTSTSFYLCATRFSLEVWPFLAAESQGLKNIENPIDFTWVDKEHLSAQSVCGKPFPHREIGHSNNLDKWCIGCNCIAGRNFKEQSNALYDLATHCLAYGGYLAQICYSPCSSSARRANHLLWDAIMN